MGMPGGTTEEIRRAADAAAADSLAVLSATRRAENKSAAAVVHAVHDLTELRFGTEQDIHELGVGEPDLGFARRAVECEAAVSLSLSRTVTRDMVTVGAQLAWRLPSIDSAFTAGDIDYPRTRAIALTLEKASDKTVSDLEADILAAALRLNTRSLRENIWKAWFAYDHEEASAAQKAAESEERCADVRRGDAGTATLIAKMSSLEGAECNAVLDELTGTVCAKDPRTKKQLRGFALLALVHREEYVACRCGLDECPVTGIANELPDRRKPLIQILMDVETLLGLTNEPATLSDGTVLDPTIARHIAADAQWQIMLTDTLDAARARLGTDDAGEDDADDATSSTAASSDGRSKTTATTANKQDSENAPHSTQADDGGPESTGNMNVPSDSGPNDDLDSSDLPDEEDLPDSNGPDNGGPDSDPDNGGPDNGRPDDGGPDNDDPGASSTGAGPGGSTEPPDTDPPDTDPPRIGLLGRPRARKFLHRGRIRPAAPLPPAPLHPAPLSPAPLHPAPTDGPAGGSTRVSSRGEESALSAAIASFLASAAADPSLTQGVYPDGHGGYTTPPPGALTYRPTAELVALTRATHCACTFPGCSVPAARCEIDHIVPFDHNNPQAGGWTILSNLQPLCKFHHQAKTSKLWKAAKLHGDSIYWVSTSGIHRITPSTYGTVMIPEKFRHTRAGGKSPYVPWTAGHYIVDLDGYEEKPQPDKQGLERRPSDALYEPTWWEINIGESDGNWNRIANIANPVADGTMRVPTLGDIARMTDPQDREDAAFIRRKFFEHRAVIAARHRHNYRAPF
ncbi:HNH endonuclease signature motif containing protein [Rhodococcoides yunnanense]|uniref:HNH endonuclease signature motif containing protein n=1 Tax=Rhodococcoides yunnanense TaxID=278209 RepID=UPI001FEA97B3|nr:HNH endonuclease signature motif containing protein [Rhodococcus yunnanensis]